MLGIGLCISGSRTSSSRCGVVLTVFRFAVCSVHVFPLCEHLDVLSEV